MDYSTIGGKLNRHSSFTQQKNLDNVLEELGKGQLLEKIKDGGKLLQRKFFVDMSSMRLMYTGSTKSKLLKKKQDDDTEGWAISLIEEVRSGEKDHGKRLKKHEKRRVVVVVFYGLCSKKPVYMLCGDITSQQKWLTGLQYAVKMTRHLHRTDSFKIWLKTSFEKADKNKDGRLDFDEILKLLQTLNAELSKNYVKQMFSNANTSQKSGEKATLDSEEFLAFFDMLNSRPEIEKVFCKYSKDAVSLTAKEFQTFLQKEQKEKETIPQSEELISFFEPQPAMKQAKKMSLSGFTSFLTAAPQHLFHKDHRRLYQNMTQPLNRYFISSSHNTYLSEDQIKGPSRVEMYIRVLKMGCRCVELDCWDGRDDEPVIYHGYTLTSRILFSDVLYAIRDYAFVTTPYPLILSIQNGCSLLQQIMMARLLERILGDKLYTPPKGKSCPPPSPEDLKFKVIVKGKKLPGTVDTGDISEDEDEGTAERKETKGKPLVKMKLIKEFSDVASMKSVSFSLTGIPKDPRCEVSSVSERKMKSLLPKDASKLCAFTGSLLLRTYPAAYRQDSSNYNPLMMWCVGSQMVALNYQTWDVNMQINHGWFMNNGNSGYVLKPQCLATEKMYKPIVGKEPSPSAKRLCIEIVSGSQLPKPGNSQKGEVIDPYVTAGIHGIELDTLEKRTKTITDNGFNPIWNEEFTFDIKVPELAIVRFAVYDYNVTFDSFIGYFCCPVNSLAEGYRHLPLFDCNGDMLDNGLVFVRIQAQSASPSGIMTKAKAKAAAITIDNKKPVKSTKPKPTKMVGMLH